MKWLKDMLVGFFVRMCIGLCLIVMINQFLVSENIEVNVGINPITAAATGALGVPGVCLLYGIVFYQSGFSQNLLQI